MKLENHDLNTGTDVDSQVLRVLLKMKKVFLSLKPDKLGLAVSIIKEILKEKDLILIQKGTTNQETTTLSDSKLNDFIFNNLNRIDFELSKDQQAVFDFEEKGILPKSNTTNNSEDGLGPEESANLWVKL